MVFRRFGRAAEGAVIVSSIPAEAQVLVFLTGSKVGLGTPLASHSGPFWATSWA